MTDARDVCWERRSPAEPPAACMIRETAEGVQFSVRVIPRAKKTAIGEARDGVPTVRLAAPPVEGAANDCLVAFVAKLFQRPRRDVRIIAGERGRLKRLAIAGVTAASARRLLVS